MAGAAAKRNTSSDTYADASADTFDGRAHAHLIHRPNQAAGNVVFGRPGRPDEDRFWIQRTIALEDVPTYAAALAGATDVYMSMQRFTGRRRRVVNLRELAAAYVDLDVHKTSWADKRRDAVVWAVLRRCRDEGAPEPWLFHSGRGLTAVWPHTPIPRKAYRRWQAVQKHLAQCLHGFGVDKAALDGARVSRVVGTYNSRRPVEPVQLVHRPDSEPVYDFDSFADDVLPVARGELVNLRRARAERRGRGSTVVPPRTFTAASLWEARLTDLQRLLHHRWWGVLPPGQRDRWLFIAGVAISWFEHYRAADVQREVNELAAQVGSWSDRETRSRMSALVQRAVMADEGQTIEFQGRQIDPRYHFKTETICDWLDITEQEMREAGLQTLVSPEIRRERGRAWMQEARGGEDRESYRQAVRSDSLKECKPWERLGMSRRTWYRRGKPNPDKDTFT